MKKHDKEEWINEAAPCDGLADIGVASANQKEMSIFIGRAKTEKAECIVTAL